MFHDITVGTWRFWWKFGMFAEDFWRWLRDSAGISEPALKLLLMITIGLTVYLVIRIIWLKGLIGVVIVVSVAALVCFILWMVDKAS